MSQMLNPTSKHAPEVIPVSALVSSAAFPRVDLLPPAIKEEASMYVGTHAHIEIQRTMMSFMAQVRSALVVAAISGFQ